MCTGLLSHTLSYTPLPVTGLISHTLTCTPLPVTAQGACFKAKAYICKLEYLALYIYTYHLVMNG